MSAHVLRGLRCLGYLALGWMNAFGAITGIRNGSDGLAAFNILLVAVCALWLWDELEGKS